MSTPRTDARSDLATARLDSGFQALLLRFSAMAAQGGDFGALIREFCCSTREFFNAAGSYFWSLTPDGVLVGTAADGHMVDHFLGARRSSDLHSVTGRSIHERKAVYINDIDPSAYPLAAEFGAHAIMAVPVILAGETAGALALLYTDDTQFSDDAADKATILAAAFSTLLEAARLAEVHQNERRHADGLLSCAQALHASLDRDAVLQALANHVLQLFGARFAAVSVLEHERERLKVASQPPQIAAEVAAICADRSSAWFDGLLKGAAESALPISLSLPRDDADPVASLIASPQAMCAPLRTATTRGAVLVCAAASQSFGEPERALLAAVIDFATLAISNAELYARSSAQSQELQQLLQISSELGSAGKLERFLQQIVVRAAEFLGFRRSFIALCEGGECHVRWSAWEGVAEPVDYKLETPSSEKVLSTGEPYWTDDAASDPGLNLDEVQKRGIGQYLAVPLKGSDGEPLGLLGVIDHVVAGPITAEDVRRAQALAAEVAVALEATRNLHISDEHRRRSETLMSLALELNASLRLPDFVRSFTMRAADVLGARAAALALAQRSVLETVILRDGERVADKQLTRRLNLALSDAAVSRHGAIEYGSASELLGPTLATALGWTDLTLARLIGGDEELLGILCLADRGRPLSAADRNLLQALSGHASVALENARLFSRIAHSNRQWAEIFDSITDFIVVHDEQHKVLRVNRSLADFIGIRPAELIGVSMRALVAMTTDPGAHPCPFCRPGQESDDDEYIHEVVDRTYLLSTSRIHGALNEGMQTIHVLKDITDRREAERRYREIFDNIQEGLYFSVPDGRFVDVNDAMVRMLGYESREELLQVDIASQLYPTDADRERFRRAVEEEGAVRNYQEMLRRKDGSLIHTLQNTFAVRDTQGRVVQYRGLMLDITELKTFQTQLVRERDFNKKILDNTQSMILVVDTAGLVSYANRRCFEAGAYTEEHLLGRRLADFIAPGSRVEFDAAFASTVAGQQVDNFELQLVRGNGRIGHFSMNLSPMRDEQGSVNSIVLVMTDITDAAIMQAKLMHTEKMAAVGQLVSGVAHEVNNPLTAILGFSDLLLQQDDLPESARKDVRVIVQEAQRTKTIVQNLLSFARQVPPQRQPVHINHLIRRTVQLRSYDFSNHAIEVRERFTEPLPDVIGDSHQLQQVFLNILNNAYDAVRETQRRGIIEIGTDIGEQCVEISFRDNGEGIVHPERIFDPFFTTKEVGKGTGLGLSICYGIVREHGGEITAQNNLGREGATFLVRLPVVAATAHRGGA